MTCVQNAETTVGVKFIVIVATTRHAIAIWIVFETFSGPAKTISSEFKTYLTSRTGIILGQTTVVVFIVRLALATGSYHKFILALQTSTCISVHHQTIWITDDGAYTIDKTIPIFASWTYLSYWSQTIGIHTVTGATLDDVGLDASTTTRRNIVETS